MVSLAGLKQIKDILKGSLRFNQSQLEAEENEEITIADNHYCSNNRAEGESIKLPQADREMQATVKTEEVTSLTSLNSDGRNSDDYILVSKEDDDLMHEHLSKKLEATGATSEKQQTLRASHASEATGKHTPQSSVFSDPLTGGVLCLQSSNSESSPDDDSSNSKDSDFTIVSPLDI